MSTPAGDGGEYTAPWERAFERILTPFERFVRDQTAGGLVLMGCALIALVLANSPLAAGYHALIETHLTIGIGEWALDKSLHHWINDGLMALFFVLVGLEIKYELLVGDLASPRQAALPMLAAIGGMLIPAALYIVFAADGAAARGWGVPMATDIAFAIGILLLLGRRVPAGLITFLAALAIVDDLGAVIVIALFYTETLSWPALGAAAVCLGMLMIFNMAGARRPLPYFLVGVLLWLALLKSGVHATLAGVLLAFTIPAYAKYDAGRFSAHVRELMDRFDATARRDPRVLTNEELHTLVQTLDDGVRHVETPLQRLTHGLHHPIALLVVPIFALANAGIPIELGAVDRLLTEPIFLGVAAGLLAGKLIGVAGVTWLALRLGIGSLPAGTTMRHIVGVGLIAGVGFTMSIFIAELAFARQPDLLLTAKTGILFASIVGGTGGYLWLRLVVSDAGRR
ncbi:MAG: Na+/H+ antiporter NhaA [Gammaproteobacteria bacterium]|nr:Na+/H+ antiporter NhaA [Gammaproteobacteria bacterium]